MVQIQLLPSPKDGGQEEAAAAPSPLPTPTLLREKLATNLDKKRHLQCVMTGLALLLGLWLTTTVVIIFIVALYCHGQNLFMRSTLPPPNTGHRQYTSTETDLQRASAYSEWVRYLEKGIKCGLDCAFYALDSKNPTLLGKESGDISMIHDAPKSASALCSDIPLSECFDCFPSAMPTQEKCVAQGCCWKEVWETPKRDRPFPAPRLHKPSHGDPQEDLPLNVPFCYYPRDYRSYHFSNLTPSDTGYNGYLSQRLPSCYPGEVDLMHFEVKMEIDTRIRIKITDPSWPIMPVVNKSSTGRPQYTFKAHLSDGTFTVARKSTALPLQDVAQTTAKASSTRPTAAAR